MVAVGDGVTHYRLTLTRGRKATTFELIAQSHQDKPRLVRGWATIMRADPTVSAHLRICLWLDDECPSYGRESGKRPSLQPDPTAAQVAPRLRDGTGSAVARDFTAANPDERHSHGTLRRHPTVPSAPGDETLSSEEAGGKR